MEFIKDLKPGTEFYFESNKDQLFILLGFIYRPNGAIKSGKCAKPGKLYPIYMRANNKVIVLKTAVIKLNPDADQRTVS